MLTGVRRVFLFRMCLMRVCVCVFGLPPLGVAGDQAP